MKKIICILAALLVGAFALSGCGEKTKKETPDTPNTSSDNTLSNTVKGFTGTISRKWDEVKDDYTSAESMAEAEVGAMTTVSREDVEKIVSEMKQDLKELESGVTTDNEEKAKEVYKDAHKLELMAEKGDVEAAKEFKSLAKNSKALVKQYYGEADEDYNTVKATVNDGIDKIGKFTDDIWNAFLDLFK